MSIINSYLKDRITLVSISSDEWGVITKTNTTGVKCRIEDENKLIMNAEGKEVYSNGYIIIDISATIDYTTRIKITSINGTSQLRQDKEYAILKLSTGHGFSNSHYEVWI